ncbi:MAG: hypothetical protein B2I17_00080 [Thermoplasmatales archaeon B_DKE]|nr:MAG: hypothetical protein B2I17_00080 [Thermoplasmatales archaeon B_DKE]
MNARIIVQGNNEENVGDLLSESFEDDSFNTFIAFIAFVSKAGANFLCDKTKLATTHLKECKIFIGVDNNGTSKEALSLLKDSIAKVKIMHTINERIIFHPKIYIFGGDVRARLVLGSSNLTHTGLFENSEASIVIDFDKFDLDNTQIASSIKRIIDKPEDIFRISQQELTQELIELLVSIGKVPSEKNRTESYTGAATNTNENNKEQNKVNSKNWEKYEALFPPVERKFSGHKLKPKKLRGTIEGYISKSVLVAEIPKGGPRWNQANFDIDTFKNFFDLNPGDRKGISLVPILENGTTGKAESRQNVTVKSHNYRIEIGKAAHLPYPLSRRPICVFIKNKNNEFLYQLYLPGTKTYSELTDILDAHWNGPKRMVRRIQLSLSDFSKEVPSGNLSQFEG